MFTQTSNASARRKMELAIQSIKRLAGYES
jgi:hypothetical protein